MKKALSLILALVLLIGFLPQMTFHATAEEAAAHWDTDGDGVLEILAIGNSFSIDALEYAWQIAHDLGIENIAIGNLYISGCTLETHAANAAGDIAAYTYYFNDSGSWSTTSNYKLSTALTERGWDFVSMQQSSKYSGVESTYNEDLTDLIAYVKASSDAKLVWHMTWAYQQDSTNKAFPIYDSNQMTMYNAIVSAVQNKIATNDAFDRIVPNGTAVQNSRTSLLGDTTTRDGYHMSRDYGRYLTGLLFIRTVTGLSADGITYAPSGVDAQEMAIAIESVNNAYANPFEVTESAYTGEAPEEGYILLQSELYKGAFWSPVTEERYDELFYDRSMSHKYFATIRFTKETLPVGSIIILADGWQYRPDGWITDTVQTGPREPTTTESYVVVTEEWWGDYTIRAFNISKVGLPSLTNVTEEEVRAAFQIYVPEESHSHAFENGVCILCGEAPAPENPFTDVTDDQWYFEPILWAVAQGITSGTSTTTFSPDATCTRAQVVTFLWRGMGQPEPDSCENPFSDVKADDYFYKAVLWAVENGITSGTGNGQFSPNRPCTRDQVVTFLWRALGKPAPEKSDNPFTDVAEGVYYYEPVLWAAENGITSGTSATTFAPSNPCTRGQVVTFLYRAFANE